MIFQGIFLLVPCDCWREWIDTSDSITAYLVGFGRLPKRDQGVVSRELSCWILIQFHHPDEELLESQVLGPIFW